MVDNISLACFNFDKESLSSVIRSNDTRVIFESETEIKLTYRHLTLTIMQNEMYIHGSISKYGNQYNANYNELGAIIVDLVTDLGLNAKETYITRIEYGINIVTNERPQKYFSMLGTLKGYRPPFDYLTTRYYVQINKQVKLYDKGKEMKSNNDVLRLEKTMNKKAIKELFGRLCLFDLLRAGTFDKLANDLKETFENIKVINTMSTQLNTIKGTTAQKYLESIFAVLLANSDINEIERNLRNNSELSAVERKRARDKIKALLSTLPTAPNDLYEELKYSVENIINNLKSNNYD